jgi:Flp pilus assembly protein TadD
MINSLEKLLSEGKDSSILRLSLGNAYADKNPLRATEHFRKALEMDDENPAIWKALGKSLTVLGEISEARETYLEGISAAEKKGFIQAAKEMKVFLRRLEKLAEK